MLEKAFKSIMKEYLESYEGIKTHADINENYDMDKMYWQGVFICDVLEGAEMTETEAYERICEILDVIMYKK